MRRFSIFRLSHDSNGPKSWLKHSVYIFQFFLKMSFIHLSMPHGFSSKIQQEPSHSKISQPSWFSQRKNPLIEKSKDLPYAWWNEISSCSPRLSLEDCYNNSLAASFFTCRSLERPCTRTLRSPERGFSVSRDSHDKQSCPFQSCPVLFSVDLNSSPSSGLVYQVQNLTETHVEALFPLVPVGSPLGPLLTGASGPRTVTSLNPYYFPSIVSSAQSLASVPLSCSLLMSPLMYYWTCLISCEWLSAWQRDERGERKRGEEKIDRDWTSVCTRDKETDWEPMGL